LDVHTPEGRSHNMSRVRSRDTRPELVLRRALHSAGLRYRLHLRNLPGRPDLVFSSRRAVIFVHGCFWHGHDCPRFSLPATREDFWKEKLEANRIRDEQVISELHDKDWRILIVWECTLRGPSKRPLEIVTQEVKNFLEGTNSQETIGGNWPSSSI
jgi:DNA mismatch endonuclease (patch repair protein)